MRIQIKVGFNNPIKQLPEFLVLLTKFSPKYNVFKE